MPTPRRRSRGATLVEALIAFLVVSFGGIALLRLQADLRAGADASRQRAEAMQLAEDDLEQLRAFATLGAASGALGSMSDVVDAERRVAVSSTSPGSPGLVLERRVRAASTAPVREVDVTVRWTDARGTAQRVALASMIAATDPGLGGALALVPNGGPSVAASAPAP